MRRTLARFNSHVDTSCRGQTFLLHMLALQASMYSCMHARTKQASDRDTITPDQNLVLEQTGPRPQALPAATLFAFLMFGTARRSVALHCDEYVEVATAVMTASDTNLTRPSMSRIRTIPNAGNRHMELERCLTLHPYGRMCFNFGL